MEQNSVPNKLYRVTLSGRLRAGKDYVAVKCGFTHFSFAEPMYQICEHFLGTANKKKEGVRELLQLIGVWGRGWEGHQIVSRVILPTKEEVEELVKCKEIFGDGWEEFGKREDFWIRVGRRVIEDRIKENPNLKLAIVNARFKEEIDAFTPLGFKHFHVMCSEESRKERLGKSYHPDLDKNITEKMAIEFDKTLPDKKVIWNDFRKMPENKHFLSLEEFKNLTK